MAPEKVTVMILNVDLKCSCCYKKVRKLLCKFPQIRDQVFDEEKNKVMITVVCCDPEKLRDKLCCKGGKAIQSIEIVDTPKPKPKPKPQPQPPVDPPPPKPVDPPPPPKPDPPKPNPPPPKPDPPKPNPPPPKPDPPKKPDPQPQPEPTPVNMPDPIGYPNPNPFCPPVSVCCQECYEGRGGGPCHYGYGRPVPPPPGPCHDGYGYGYGYQYAAGNRPCYVSRCDYFSEENPQGCSIM